MKRLFVVLALVMLAGNAHATCGYCTFAVPPVCQYVEGIRWACFYEQSTGPYSCWMYESQSCGYIGINGASRDVAAWKTHEPRFYTAEASRVIAEWKGKTPIPHYVLSRFRVDPSQAPPNLAEALRQRTHYEAMQVLARAGLLEDRPDLVEALAQ